MHMCIHILFIYITTDLIREVLMGTCQAHSSGYSAYTFHSFFRKCLPNTQV